MEILSEDTRVDGRLAVVARPTSGGPWPGVVMLHEAWGVDEVLRRQAQRLASAGFVVLAPDLLGEGPQLGCMRALVRSFRSRSGLPFQLIEQAREQLLGEIGRAHV